MAALDSAVNAYKAEISKIGLSKSNVVGGEVTGGGYARQTVSYSTSSGGAASADLSATLHFTGTPNDGPVTHLIFEFVDASTVVRPVAASASFNSDGLLDVTSAEVTAALGS